VRPEVVAKCRYADENHYTGKFCCTYKDDGAKDKCIISEEDEDDYKIKSGYFALLYTPAKVTYKMQEDAKVKGTTQSLGDLVGEDCLNACATFQEMIPKGGHEMFSGCSYKTKDGKAGDCEV